MGLYRRITRKSNRKQSIQAEPLPIAAQLSLVICLCLATLSILIAYLRNQPLDTELKSTTSRQSATLLPNNTYNVDTTFCNIPRVLSTDLTVPTFVADYAGKNPVIIIDKTHNRDFSQHVTKTKLISNFGNIKVILSASNSYTKAKKTVTVEQYINTIMATPQTLKSLGNESWYLFGDNYGDEWNPLLDRLQISKFAGNENTLSFGVGGQGSGVPFHFHGGGFSEVFFGRKRWFLTKHQHAPTFNPDESMLQWVHSKYGQIKDYTKIYECTIKPGEMLYFPSQWHHGVLNLDSWTAFVSTFTLGEDLIGVSRGFGMNR